MIISIYGEKAFDIFEHFMIKKFIKIGVEENFFNMMKDIYKKIPNYHHTQW